MKGKSKLEVLALAYASEIETVARGHVYQKAINEINHKLDLVLEIIADIPLIKLKVNKLESDMEEVKADIRVLKDIAKSHSRQLQKHNQLLNDQGKLLKEHSATLKEHSTMLKEHGAILKEHSVTLQEHSTMLHSLSAKHQP